MAHEDNALGARLRWARDRKLITQEALAKETGVERATISNLERGKLKSRPQYRTIRALALALGVDAAWLLTGERDDEEPQERTKGEA